MRSLTIVGAGRVGRTLARLWREAGTFTIADVVATRSTHATEAVTFIGGGRPRTHDEPLAPADLYLLSVPDNRIRKVARTLAKLPAMRPGVVAFHCSGALDARELESLAGLGVACASLHPMHSFADPQASLERFAGSCCALEGDADALAVLRPAIAAIGGRGVAIDADGKPLYHAAGVLASNYLVALLDSADNLLATAGFAAGDRRALLEPLVRGTVDNLFEQGSELALSGPIVRGDAGLVARQLTTITRRAPRHTALYRALGEAALDLAARGDRLDAAGAARIAAALDLTLPSGEQHPHPDHQQQHGEDAAQVKRVDGVREPRTKRGHGDA